MRTALVIVLLLGVAVTAYFALSDRTPTDEVHTDRSIEAWATQLDDDDKGRRFQAGLMLAEYGEAAIPALVARLRRDVEMPPSERGDPDAEGEPRHIAADTLVMIGRPAVPHLIKLLEVEAHYERALAQRALITIGVTDDDLSALTPLLGHANPITAGMAAHLIGTLPGGRDAMLFLIEQNADDEATVHRALLTLGRIANDEPDPMTPFLSHVSPVVRREALHVLRLVGASADQAERIAALLGDEDEQVRAWAATVLRRLKAEAQFALVATARDGQPTAARLAIGLIGELGPGALSAVPVLRARLDDPAAAVRAAAAEAMHAITRVEDDALPVLLEVVAGGDREARVLAIAALGGFEESAAQIVPVLSPLLQDPDVELARVVAISLGNLGPAAKPAIEALQRAAASGNEPLARAADQALDLIRSGD
ncbi:MAG: HEAT repeat domain-containing protein [Planctomycetota bacterium]|nr:HEAT repeat domain-containing protein [Planctomycetota bacterium]